MMVIIATLTLIRGLSSYLVKAHVMVTYLPAMRHLSKIEVGNVYITIIAMIVLVVVLEILLKKSAILKGCILWEKIAKPQEFMGSNLPD